jgi:hypothetical protein
MSVNHIRVIQKEKIDESPCWCYLITWPLKVERLSPNDVRGTVLSVAVYGTDDEHEEARNAPSDEMIVLLQLTSLRVTFDDLKGRRLGKRRERVFLGLNEG